VPSTHSHAGKHRRRAFLDVRYATRYGTGWSSRYEGLGRLYGEGDPRGVNREHAEKLRGILARLDAAGTVADINCRGSGFMPSKGS
jgi:hypothetical protein